MAFFSFLLLAQPSQAETSEDFNELDLFFYGDYCSLKICSTFKEDSL